MSYFVAINFYLFHCFSPLSPKRTHLTRDHRTRIHDVTAIDTQGIDSRLVCGVTSEGDGPFRISI